LSIKIRAEIILL